MNFEPVLDPVKEVLSLNFEPVLDPVKEVLSLNFEPVLDPVKEVLSLNFEPVLDPVKEVLSLNFEPGIKSRVVTHLKSCLLDICFSEVVLISPLQILMTDILSVTERSYE